MRRHFDQQMESLKAMVLKMGSIVEDEIDMAIKSLENQNMEMAEKVFTLEDQIDELEGEIEEKCLSLLTLQQPIAKDLRIISTILKIITDLERIGDHGANIAEITLKIGEEKLIKPLIDIPRMAHLTKKMVRGSLDSFVAEDLEKAKETANMDDMVDAIYENIYMELLEMISENKTIMKQVIHLLLVGRFLERIADHATNICERVMYMVTGKKIDY